jgi:cysteine desulfurase
MGLASALTLAIDDLQTHRKFMEELRDKFEAELARVNPTIRILGANAPRLPNTSLIIAPNIEGELMVHRLLEFGVAASTGSACSNGSDQPSHVVTAMGVPFSLARNVLRISLSRLTSHDEIEACVIKISAILV